MPSLFYCRIGFLLLCVAPTLATAGTLVARRASDWFVGSKGSWETRLSQRLGFNVSLAKVTRPHAATMLLEGVELTDRETGKTVAKVRLVEAAQTDQGLVLVVSQPEIFVEEFSSLAGSLHETLLRGEPVGSEVQPTAANSATTIHILAGELLIRTPESAQTFHNVEGNLESLPSGPRATIRFRLPGGVGDEPAQLQVTRNREHTPPRTRWELHTGGEPLACSLLAAYLEPLAMLGSECEFHGVAWGEHSPGGWVGDISGRLTKLDLETLVTRRFPHKLSGLADVTFNRAHFQAGRLVDAAGSLDSPGGVVGQSLVEAATELLELDAADRAAHIKRWPVRYERLSAGFTLNESGLSLTGTCDGEGVLLVASDGPLLSSRSRHRVPVVSLVRALSPASSVQVPATAETDALLRALPIPPFVPADETSRPPTATVRLQNEKAKR